MAKAAKKSARPAKTTVLLTWAPPKNEMAMVKARLPKGLTILTTRQRPELSPYETNYEDVADLVPKADLIIAKMMPDGLWEKATRMKCLCTLNAGVQDLPLPLFKERGVRVANARGGNAIDVAEQAMMLVLALAKRLVVKHENMEKARWVPFWAPENLGIQLVGRTMTIVGYGSIGQSVAKLAKAFDRRVSGVRQHPEKGGEHADAMYGIPDMHKALGLADVVVLSTPLTKLSTGFIDEAAIAAMKPTALLVNVARAHLVPELPLYQALTSGRLGGYASDVWWFYEDSYPPSYHFPSPSRTNLQHLPNVICSPDQAARTPEDRPRMLGMALDNARAYLDGKPMPQEIGYELGY